MRWALIAVESNERKQLPHLYRSCQSAVLSYLYRDPLLDAVNGLACEAYSITVTEFP